MFYDTAIGALEACFKEAKQWDASYVGITVTVPGCESVEVIINPKANFDAKLEYYKKAYNEDLTLKANPEIEILRWAYGDSFDELEEELSN